MSNWAFEYGPANHFIASLIGSNASELPIDVRSTTLPVKHIWTYTPSTPLGQTPQSRGPFLGAVCNLGTDANPERSLHLWVGKKDNRTPSNQLGADIKIPGAYVRGIRPSGTQISITGDGTFLEALQRLVEGQPRAPSLAALGEWGRSIIVIDSGDVNLHLGSSADGATTTVNNDAPSGQSTSGDGTSCIVVTVGMSPTLDIVGPNDYVSDDGDTSGDSEAVGHGANEASDTDSADEPVA